MLYEFLAQYEKEIIQICKTKIEANSDSKPTSATLDKGLPIFYKEIIEILKRTAKSPKHSAFAEDMKGDSEKRMKGPAAEHGKESLRLGYTISQVVHYYGAVCQSITEFIQTKNFKIESAEFHDFNLALDCAIAEAVTEFEKGAIKKDGNGSGDGEIKLSPALLQKIKNSLGAVSISYQTVRKGLVGSAGDTSEAMGKSLEHLSQLIDSV